MKTTYELVRFKDGTYGIRKTDGLFPWTRSYKFAAFFIDYPTLWLDEPDQRFRCHVSLGKALACINAILDDGTPVDTRSFATATKE